MKFTSKCKIPPGKNELLEFPNMTRSLLIPTKVTLFDSTAGADVPVKEICCKIASGGSEIVNLTEPYFVRTNAIPLADYAMVVKRGCDLTVNLANKCRDVKQFTVIVEYERCFGPILFQQKTDKFDRVLKDIHALGTCTQLNISFNRPVKELQLRTLTEFDGNDWISPLEVSISEDPEPVYSIEFTEDLAVFGYNLNFMQLVVTDSTHDDQAEPLQMYVTALGYTNKK
jgi:hypothetical protein